MANQLPKPESINIQVKLTDQEDYVPLTKADGSPVVTPSDFAERVRELESTDNFENASITYWYPNAADAQLVKPRFEAIINGLELSGRTGLSKGKGFDPSTGEPKKSRLYYSHRGTSSGVPESAFDEWL